MSAARLRRSARGEPGARGERGEALLLALFVLFMLGVSLAMLALTIKVRLEEQQREIRRARLELLLDGVMAETMARLAIDARFKGVTLRPEGAGEAWTDVERLSPEVARVEAAAAMGSRRAAGTALVQLIPSPPRVLQWRRGRPPSP